MLGYAKLTLLMFECMLLSVEPTLNLLKLKFTTRNSEKLLEYIYIYPLRILVL